MDSLYLDKVLQVVQYMQGNNKTLTFAEFSGHRVISQGFHDAARRYLKERGFITESEVSPYYIHITGMGERHIATGGFKKEEEIANSSLTANRIAKQSRTLSWIAIIVSALVGIAVAYFQYRTK